MKRDRIPAPVRQLELGIAPLDRKQQRLTEAAQAKARGYPKAGRAMARHAFNRSKGETS